ncbi:hypothetical protein V5O48_000442 [Marasmius crinis-equi]|uniref:Uncharacterized protein n=1 Tax=Marasmius crinis-equi TaxID=585013 RepID=A0ABR3G1D7_9AGAR
MQQPNYTPYYSQAPYYPNQPYEANGANANYTPYYPQYQSWPAAARQGPYTNPFSYPQLGNQQQQQQQRQNTQPQLGNAMPLKSSLKRHDTVPAAAGATPAMQPTQTLKRRKRSKSNPQNQNPPEAPEGLNRQRTISGPKPQEPEQDYPTRMFLSLNGSDEIHLENLSTPAMGEIRKLIFPIWPYGMVLDELKNLDWRVRFSNSPWSMSSENGAKAQEMLLKLFTLFARRGYSFQTTISTGTSAPRLVFLATAIDNACQFFFALPVNGGKKITFIQPPRQVRNKLFSFLEQSKLKGHIEPHYDEQSTSFSIELRQGLYTGESITPAHLLDAVLHKLEFLDVQLETSLPMARRGPFAKLGFGQRPEFFLLKLSPSN